MTVPAIFVKHGPTIQRIAVGDRIAYRRAGRLTSWRTGRVSGLWEQNEIVTVILEQMVVLVPALGDVVRPYEELYL